MLFDRLRMKKNANAMGRSESASVHCCRPEDADVSCHLSGEAVALAERLQRNDGIERTVYDILYRECFESDRTLIVGQDEYGPQHKERFWEMFNACALLLQGRSSPHLLEFGTSEFSAFFKPLVPELTLHLSDRPTESGYIGFTETVSKRLTHCEEYYSIDLEDVGTAMERPPVCNRKYDLIVFAEVIEHLDVNPVELLNSLFALLKMDGFLYLTTPNFFRRDNLSKLARFENPQEVFPAHDGNWDRHHHHREYGAKELLHFTEEAGGETAAFYFSACWDSDHSIPVHERGNMVLVARPASR